MNGLPRLTALLTVGVAISVAAQAPGPAALRPDDPPPPQAACGTSPQWEMNGRIRAEALPGGLADGEPFTFEQDPPILSADYTGPITLHNFSVVGDFATVQFLRSTRDAPDGVAETWTRAATRSVGGQVISVFEPTWTATELDAALSYRRVGLDRPFVYWGAFPVGGGAALRYVYLRFGFGAIPSSPVVRINDSVQYASDVVNLVVPTFDDARVAGGQNGFDLAVAAPMFYRYFSDAYDVLAFTSEPVSIGDFGAFHRNVRNAVAGINLNTFDSSRNYGSPGGILQGVEVYGSAYAARYEDTDHEMSHQWASNFDWTRISNIARAGHQPTAHSPLWTGGETLVGAVLLGNRRVTATGASAYAIEQTPAPAHYHPIEQYAMGLIPADRVPDFLVFADQGQFDAANAAAPTLGTAVAGAAQPASINDVVRVHGPRQGPAISSPWRRATVLVSKNRLASQQQMDFWNFFAQRLGDRNHASRPNFDNFVSFPRATGGAVDLATAIRPASAPPLAQTLDVDTPAFGPIDWRGIQLTSPLPSRFAAGESVTVTGRVTAADPVDFTSITLAFWGLNATTAVNFSGAVNRTRDFTVTIRFTEAQRGAYYLSNYLFWAGSGSQYPRSSVSTIVVE